MKFSYTGENESRAIIQPQSLNDPAVKELMKILIDWINDELAEDRIIVKDIEEDLYDGQVLHKLLEKLTGRSLDVPEVTQSAEGQREKLQIVLNAVNHVIMSGFRVVYILINSNNTIYNTQFLSFHRPSVSTKNCQNGMLKVCIQKIWLQFCICSFHSFVTSVLRFVCPKMCMSPLSLLRRTELC